MNIAVIIHNPKGPTKHIAKKLVKNFEEQKHTVTLKILQPNTLEDGSIAEGLKENPRIEDYDVIIFGAPLIKGELSPVMVDYIKQLPTTEGKISSGYITQFFFSSGKKAEAARQQMIDLIVEKNIKVKKVEQMKWINPFLGKDV